jgi:thioredoxin
MVERMLHAAVSRLRTRVIPVNDNTATRLDERTRKENGMTGNGGPVAVTDADFGDVIEKHQGLAIVDFWAVWCGPCRLIAPVIDQLSKDYAGKVQFAKLDVDSNQQTSIRFSVRSIPSILFFKDGKHVDTVVGAVPKKHLEQKIQEHM